MVTYFTRFREVMSPKNIQGRLMSETSIHPRESYTEEVDRVDEQQWNSGIAFLRISMMPI